MEISYKEITQKIISSKKERVGFFKRLQPNIKGLILTGLTKNTQRYLLSKLRNPEIIELLRYVDPDKATDILQNIEHGKRNRIIKKLKIDMKNKVEFLLKFDPRTAAGMMSLNYIEVEQNATVGSVAKVLKKHEKQTGRIPVILVVHDNYLVGELPVHVLVLYDKRKKIKNCIKRVASIMYNNDSNDIISAFKTHPHNKIVVLDDDKSILGVIYSDDVLQILNRQKNNLHSFAGISNEEDVLDSAFFKVKNRYRWLILNLATAFLAAFVVSLFQDTISAFVLLAVYMPIVAGMGGNAGTQTLAVVVRGMTLKEITPQTGKRIFVQEGIAGIINGAIIGVIVAIVASFWNQTPLLGLIIGLSIIINLGIAGLFGTIIPIVLRQLGKDPATSASIFITTATDVCGFFVFLGLAKTVL